ncbi:hypothetical protein JTE90_024363 [Oedothorax gibbosus]|uniref:Uncharacterized protein n=1 Tax=Oedothorax gibbosus TaxID=931172 RepID=A0AAV6W153_9ARAC|nr:hypothetical protein JTE90_024363 [Oedothorax gibbosus]
MKTKTNSVTEEKSDKKNFMSPKDESNRKELNSSIQIGKHQKRSLFVRNPKGDLWQLKNREGFHSGRDRKKKEIFHYFPVIVSTVTVADGPLQQKKTEVLKVGTLRAATIPLGKGLNSVFCL